MGGTLTEPNRYGKNIESLYSQLLAAEAEADAAESEARVARDWAAWFAAERDHEKAKLSALRGKTANYWKQQASMMSDRDRAKSKVDRQRSEITRLQSQRKALKDKVSEVQAVAEWFAAEAKWWEWGEFCNRRDARHLDEDYGLIIDRVLEWADDYAEAFDRPEVPALLRQIIRLGGHADRIGFDD